jgi:glycosyltransferase involved in cell wall biosynthesis
MITIDCRMWNASGIGTYLQNLVPRVARRMPETEFALLGDVEVLAGAIAGNVSVRALNAPIYSICEQWAVTAAIPAGTSLHWSPHYNVPVFASAPLLVTIHDALHVAMPELFPGWNKRVYAALMFRAALYRARAVLTVSGFTSNELQRLFGTWAAPQRLHVVSNGVDEAWFAIQPAVSPCAREYLLYVGNVKPHKNLRGLVAAFGEIKDRLDVDLVIVGEREGFLTGDSELIDEAKQLGERVRFTGRVSQEALGQYYVHAKALVLPSFYEGFGLTALEAMAAGCPVAVSRAASLPEVCGDAALYFNPGNTAEMAGALTKIVQDEPLRKTLQAKGIERAREFTWENAADRTVRIIRELLR